MFANLNAGDVRGNRFELTAHFARCVGLEIKHVLMARATGQDESLEPSEVTSMFAGMEPMDEAIRGSGMFGPRVPVPDDADAQTKLIAFTGRQP